MTRILHRNEKELVRILFKESRAMAVHSLADDAGMSWITAKKYLQKLVGRRIVQKAGNRYMLNYKVIMALARRGK